ncbi:hypothetical protein EHQ27_13700 [Leptospira wolffii]|uniref:CcmD family protein n=1 Tax=Leptospira wolffii TaxID=409998 RepID=A0A2M9ZF67_9LEPT|nr:hypothetical protein [Leptospira wolffii]PJZ67080.1 hypothetical protein CH371_03115 [Leptospira wolffii]TGK62057.1 hypothetical protein EHQ32_04255 [Leptospira wolffii]TGK68659.1 hypothetical protein EHQ27_13700 [Leptospira wolffii]TGK74557.1 hypothetical protein EHQ35_09520 [Leptospira wolffii]TGL31867.1 hypothetical protein EHQ57_03155 [Leptospira wolffii]
MNIRNFGIAFILLLLSGSSVLAEEKEPPVKITAKEFLEMKLDAVFPLIQNMKKQEADVLLTQIREEARKSWAQSDNYFFLVDHLATIKAIEEEQNRLKGLLWVYLLGLALFGGFVLYVLFRQRKLIRELNELLKDR